MPHQDWSSAIDTLVSLFIVYLTTLSNGSRLHSENEWGGMWKETVVLCIYYLSRCQHCLWEITKTLRHDCLSTKQDLNPGHTKRHNSTTHKAAIRNEQLVILGSLSSYAGRFPVTVVCSSHWHPFRHPLDTVLIVPNVAMSLPEGSRLKSASNTSSERGFCCLSSTIVCCCCYHMSTHLFKKPY